jgi:DNA-binding NarL/FixJ family response regulator
MKNIEILIVTRSVVLQQGLGALLESLPDISSAKAIRDLTSAYAWIEAHQPSLIFIDSNVIGSNPKTALEKIQTHSPKTQPILLVDDVEKGNLMSKYAEAILIKGAAPSAVASIVTNLLSEKGDDHEHNDSNEWQDSSVQRSAGQP